MTTVMMDQLFIYYLIVVNVATFFIFGRDKYRAKVQGWRISEQTLLYLTALGGGIGAMIGQSFFRHKTTKGSFVWKFWVIVVLWMLVLLYFLLRDSLLI